MYCRIQHNIDTLITLIVMKIVVIMVVRMVMVMIMMMTMIMTIIMIMITIYVATISETLTLSTTMFPFFRWVQTCFGNTCMITDMHGSDSPDTQVCHRWIWNLWMNKLFAISTVWRFLWRRFFQPVKMLSFAQRSVHFWMTLGVILTN